MDEHPDQPTQSNKPSPPTGSDAERPNRSGEDLQSKGRRPHLILWAVLATLALAGLSVLVISFALPRFQAPPQQSEPKPVSPQHLVYEEPLNLDLQELAIQADALILRTTLEVGADPDSIEADAFPAQGILDFRGRTLWLHLHVEPQRFAARLSDLFAEQLPQAMITPSGPRQYSIIINNVRTHELTLEYPDVKPYTPAIPTLPAEIKGRMSIVIDDMGEDLRLAQGLAETGLKLTFAVWPASSEKDRIRELAHRHGLDLMVHLPMQPLGYPDMDPGPGALFVTMTPQEIETTIKWNLDQIPEAVGVNNHMGSLFTADLQGMTSALTAISRRGLFFLDSRTIGKSSGHAAALATRTPFYSRDVFIDNEKNIAYIIGQLRKAEAMARRRGSAIAIGHPHPETLAALRQWNMNKGADILVVSITGLPPETP